MKPYAGKVERSDTLDSVLGSVVVHGSPDAKILVTRKGNRRTIQKKQRYGRDMDEAQLEFNSENGVSCLGQSVEEIVEQRISSAIFEMLSSREHLTESEIDGHVKGATTLKRKTLRVLVAEEQILREGAGERNDPFRYRLKCGRCKPALNGRMDKIDLICQNPADNPFLKEQAPPTTPALGVAGGKMKSKNEWHKAMYNKAFAEETIGSQRFIELAKKQVAFLVEATNLKLGDSVLDVPCGVGRHSLEFAKYGAKVIGVDISKDCLKIAKQKFKHKNVQYLHGSMQDLKKFKRRFDLVVNLFTSFGYFFTDEENFKVLKSMTSCLTPGGKVIVNLIDRDFILPLFQPARWNEVDGRMVLEASRYDKKTKYNESQMFMVNKKFSPPKLEHYHYHRVRLYSKAEMVDLMKKAGLTNIKVYGDFDGGPYKKGKSTHPIYVGTKK